MDERRKVGGDIFAVSIRTILQAQPGIEDVVD